MNMLYDTTTVVIARYLFYSHTFNKGLNIIQIVHNGRKLS